MANKEAKKTMKDLAKQTIDLIVDVPGDLKIEEEEQDDLIILTLRMNKNDVGKVIGRHGQNIGAIRVFLKAVCVKNFSKRLIVSVDEQN